MLLFKPALTHPDLLSFPILHFLQTNLYNLPLNDICVAEINPDYADGYKLCSHYNLPLEDGANCVVIEAIRKENRFLGACLVPTESRINFNSVVRKTLKARRISLAPLAEVLALTHMEYGSITAIGLPDGWPILIDKSLISKPRVIIGSGLVKSKVSLPGTVLSQLPGAVIIEGLAK